MTSDLQIASNRENARKSTGPRTTEGKAVVARNGLTHGLTGRFRLLDGESLATLENLLADLAVEHRPEGQTESFLVRQLAELQVRLDRASALESELMSAVVDSHAPATTPTAILARTFLKDCTFDVALLRLSRYKNSLRRSHLATLRELRQQQKCRHSQAPVVNQPCVSDAMNEIVKDPRRIPAAAAPRAFDKANPVPGVAAGHTVEIDSVK